MSAGVPVAPIVGVGGVIVRDRRAVIVRRAHEPRQGEWSLPGGRVELGETLVDAVRREMKEETGLDVAVGPIVEVFDRVDRAAEGRVLHHFVIIDYVCAPIGGTVQAGDDAEAVAWVTCEELDDYGVHPHAAGVIRRVLAAQEGPLKWQP